MSYTHQKFSEFTQLKSTIDCQTQIFKEYMHMQGTTHSHSKMGNMQRVEKLEVMIHEHSYQMKTQFMYLCSIFFMSRIENCKALREQAELGLSKVTKNIRRKALTKRHK